MRCWAVCTLGEPGLGSALSIPWVSTKPKQSGLRLIANHDGEKCLVRRTRNSYSSDSRTYRRWARWLVNIPPVSRPNMDQHWNIQYHPMASFPDLLQRNLDIQEILRPFWRPVRSDVVSPGLLGDGRWESHSDSGHWDLGQCPGEEVWWRSVKGRFFGRFPGFNYRFLPGVCRARTKSSNTSMFRAKMMMELGFMD